MTRSFDEAASDYFDAIERCHAATEHAVQRRRELTGVKQRIEILESAVFVSGVVSGNNAEARKASLLLECNAKHEWRSDMNIAANLQCDIQSEENTAAMAINDMSLARREMDYAIAVIGMETAFKAASGTEPKEQNHG